MMDECAVPLPRKTPCNGEEAVMFLAAISQPIMPLIPPRAKPGDNPPLVAAARRATKNHLAVLVVLLTSKGDVAAVDDG